MSSQVTLLPNGLIQIVKQPPSTTQSATLDWLIRKSIALDNQISSLQIEKSENESLITQAKAAGALTQAEKIASKSGTAS